MHGVKVGFDDDVSSVRDWRSIAVALMQSIVGLVLCGAFGLVSGVGLASDRGASKSTFNGRGASNVTGWVRRDATHLEVEIRNAVPGAYRIGVAVRCPREEKPSDVRTGRVAPDRRSGLQQQPLEMEAFDLGALIVDDRTPTRAQFVLPSVAKRRGLNAVLIREEEGVSPSLSDRFGLVACTFVSASSDGQGRQTVDVSQEG